MPQQLRLGNYILNVSFDRPTIQALSVLSGGLVIAIGEGEYVLAGIGLTVTFEAAGLGDPAGDPLVGLLSVEEGKFVNGQWLARRRLNGDETHQGRHLRLVPGKFGIQRIKLYRYR